MLNDFKISIYIGITILLFFWLVILVFIKMKKPINSKLSFSLITYSLVIFAFVYVFTYFLFLSII